MLSLNELYAFFADTFPGFNNADKNAGWKNTIRHNLSHLKYFIKSPLASPEPGKGNMWMFDPKAAVEDGFVIDLTPDELLELEEQNKYNLEEQPRCSLRSLNKSKSMSATSEATLVPSEIKKEEIDQPIKEEITTQSEYPDVDELVVTTAAPVTTCTEDYFKQLMADYDDLTQIHRENVESQRRPSLTHSVYSVHIICHQPFQRKVLPFQHKVLCTMFQVVWFHILLLLQFQMLLLFLLL